MTTTCDKGHRTIRMDTLPCPHPDCWRGGVVLVVAKPPVVAVDYASGLIGTTEPYREERWTLGRYRLSDGTILWGWRP